MIIDYLRTAYRLLLKCTTACLDDPAFAVLSDPSSPHFTIHHPDISVLNIMIAYDDTTRVTGIIDWEGAAVLPIWSHPTGQRLLSVHRPGHATLQDMRSQILDEQVPDYKRLRLLAGELRLDYMTLIMRYNAATWMTRSSLDGMFMQWLDGFSQSKYHRYYDEFRDFIQGRDS